MKKNFKIFRYKKTLTSAGLFLSLLVISPFIFTSILCGDREQVLQISEISAKSQANYQNKIGKQSVKVMTLNLAHGRSDSLAQFMLKKKTIKNNLNTIADVLNRENPDIVALQEADGPSFWSGKFNHVKYLAEKAGFSNSIQGAHVDGLNLSYGTAMLSKIPLTNAKAFTFAPSPPTFSKGYIIASAEIPQLNRQLDIVSVHLDFASKTVREKQVKEMIAELSSRKNPVVIMGDFNCQFSKKCSAVYLLAKSLGLKAYKPDSTDMETFPALNKRLDWILVSNQLEFKNYSTLVDDNLSDHYAVTCELEMKKYPQTVAKK